MYENKRKKMAIILSKQTSIGLFKTAWLSIRKKVVTHERTHPDKKIKINKKIVPNIRSFRIAFPRPLLPSLFQNKKLEVRTNPNSIFVWRGKKRRKKFPYDKTRFWNVFKTIQYTKTEKKSKRQQKWEENFPMIKTNLW